MYDADSAIKIIDQLYLGSFVAADLYNLKKNDITAVLCLANDSHIYNDDINLLHIDDISNDMSIESFSIAKLEKGLEFIDEQIRRGNNVLVHCVAGTSRSPTMIIAYLMKTMGLSISDACQFVRKRASHINPTYPELLEQYYYSLH